ncbi:BID domain-containing T4SS effector [Brucella pituitosa]|uniref:BID domain-containing T4SS effector n=1 Tax=Brucella pituitosa TaxID=571256 RepID=UPI0012FE1836|nr:BID domain-containing T4SS effector [Brucella pituitosa]
MEKNTGDYNDLLMPARHLPDLTPGEIAESAMASPVLQTCKAEIERLSQIVFGDPAAMSTRMRAIDTNPVLASATAEIVRYWPEEIAPLPGKPAGWIRSSSPERQHAETYVPILADAIKDYGHALSYERRRITEIYDVEQRRLRQEVPAPSSQLSAALRSMPEERVAHFRECPDLHKELTRISVQIDRRLAPHEHKAFQVGDLVSAQKSIGVPMEQVKEIAQVKQQIAETSKLVRGQQRTLTQNGPVIAR